MGYIVYLQSKNATPSSKIVWTSHLRSKDSVVLPKLFWSSLAPGPYQTNLIIQNSFDAPSMAAVVVYLEAAGMSIFFGLKDQRRRKLRKQ